MAVPVILGAVVISVTTRLINVRYENRTAKTAAAKRLAKRK